MKKYIAVALIVVVVLTLAACSNDEDVLSQIYEIGGDSLSGAEDDNLNHVNVVSDIIIYSQEFPEGTTISYDTGMIEYSLIYHETRYYPAREMTVHSYFVNGFGKSEFNLREDGSVFTILGDGLRAIDIDIHASPEEVRALMEPVTSDLVDFSLYEHTDLDIYPFGEGFGRYEFRYYNMEQGYYTDIATVAVRENGNIANVVIENLPYDTSSIGIIDKEREAELIQKKLKSMCDSKTVEYQDYELRRVPRFKVYQNELCIYYSLDCNVYDLERETEDGFIAKLLIPVRLLTES